MTPFYEDAAGIDLYLGDVRAVLREMPAESVQTCITSPPSATIQEHALNPQLFHGGDGLGRDALFRTQRRCPPLVSHLVELTGDDARRAFERAQLQQQDSLLVLDPEIREQRFGGRGGVPVRDHPRVEGPAVRGTGTLDPAVSSKRLVQQVDRLGSDLLAANLLREHRIASILPDPHVVRRALHRHITIAVDDACQVGENEVVHGN